jgi:hypothetical protein
MERSLTVLFKFRQQYTTGIKVLYQAMSGSAGNDTAAVVVKHDTKKSTFFIQLDEKGKIKNFFKIF